MTRILYDGSKALDMELLAGDAGWVAMGNGGLPLSPDVRVFYEHVGLLYACTHIRAKSLSKVPWAIEDAGDKAVWEKGQKPPPSLVGLAELPKLLRKTEAALCLGAQAYWHKELNRVRVTNLRWLAPVATAPYYDIHWGLDHFIHNTGVAMENIPVEEMVYFRYEHPLHETLRDRSPAEASMRSAGVLYNVDDFVSKFFERGAIKATLLTVKGNPPKAEMDRIKAWWKRFFQGVRNAFGAEVLNADGIMPVVVGEGISELSNTDLTGEKREDLAITMGVPQSMLFADAANYATAGQDEQNFYNSTIVPDCDLISEQLNEQLFAPMGLHLAFHPEAMNIFQEDAKQKAQAFAAYVSAGLKPSIAAEIVAVPLPEGIEYADLDAAKEEADAQAAAMQQTQLAAMQQQQQQPAQANTPQGDNIPAKALEERRFKAWARKRRDPDPSDFHSHVLSDADKAAILAELAAHHGGVYEKEGGAGQPFFTGSPLGAEGAITPDTLKAMVLQLKPGDDEAEQQVRMSVEKHSARDVKRAFSDMLDTLYPQGYEFESASAEAQRAHDEFMHNQALKDALDRALLNGTDLGVSVAVNQLEHIGYGFDYTLANLEARQWAQQHVGQLISGISDTTQKGVQQAVARFIDNGEPLEQLIADLEPFFGRQRAERIAATEVTRAYQQGSETAWKQSGVVSEMEWVTVNDEKVCVQCGPMDEQRAPLGGTFDGTPPPPLHVSCRCFTRPVIAEPSS